MIFTISIPNFQKNEQKNSTNLKIIPNRFGCLEIKNYIYSMKGKVETLGTVTKEQIMTNNRKASREAEYENQDGWKANEKVHQSQKSYSRKSKHKERY
jgi:hypothetical protein